MNGTVKWFNATKRFGFITVGESEPDVFVHASDLEGGPLLTEGESVAFDLGEDTRGRAKAVRVRVLPVQAEARED